MKRFFDLILVCIAILVTLLPIIFIGMAIKFTSSGPFLYWSDRIGAHRVIFSMPKFRTMILDTPSVATHLLKKPEAYYTPIGHFLRSTSLDELPQLWSILKGDMSFVGPRPALFNQDDLVELREKKGINKLKPGLTGWAQTHGRDEISISDKVKLEEDYLKKMSCKMDVYILWLTLIKVMKKDSITH